MITNKFSEREKFYHIVLRVKRERKLSWREAWGLVSKADYAVNKRRLFPTFVSFERFHFRYNKEMVVKNTESALKIDEMHDFCGITEGLYVRELLATDGVHVNQLNRKGRSWIDVEEAGREKRAAALIQGHEQGKYAGATKRKRKRVRALGDKIPQGTTRSKSKKSTRADRHDRAR
jgi:hypothetical protein